MIPTNVGGIARKPTPIPKPAAIKYLQSKIRLRKVVGHCFVIAFGPGL